MAELLLIVRLGGERVALPAADVESVVKTTGQVVATFGRPERVGVTFPGVVVQGKVLTAANVDKSWVDAPAARLFTEEIGCPVTVINDADAAGIAEMAFGVGVGHPGTVVDRAGQDEEVVAGAIQVNDQSGRDVLSRPAAQRDARARPKVCRARPSREGPMLRFPGAALGQRDGGGGGGRSISSRGPAPRAAPGPWRRDREGSRAPSPAPRPAPPLCRTAPWRGGAGCGAAPWR